MKLCHLELELSGYNKEAKHPCEPKLRVMFRHTWALTRDTIVLMQLALTTHDNIDSTILVVVIKRLGNLSCIEGSKVHEHSYP